MDRYSFCNFHLKVFSGVSSHGPSSVLPSTIFDELCFVVWLETDDFFSPNDLFVLVLSLKACQRDIAIRAKAQLNQKYSKCRINPTKVETKATAKNVSATFVWYRPI